MCNRSNLMAPRIVSCLALSLLAGTANYAGHKVHYTLTGDAQPALVLVHGWPCDETFWSADVPELAKGQGVYLQRYKDGELLDATTFTWKEGLRSENGKLYAPSDLKDFKGERAQTGRVLPKGWARTGKLAGN